MRPLAVLFDLDDTLYPEIEFFRSGFGVVAEELAARGAGQAAEIRELLEALHLEDRARVFDRAAWRLGFPSRWCPELVRRFHEHPPRGLTPFDGVTTTLEALRRDYRLGLVSDGWMAVQRRKLEALGLEPLLDAVVLSDELGGREHWKPGPRPFRACCERLGVPAERAVFVGDHPRRDVAGARAAGLAPVRIRRPGGYFAAEPDDPGEPEAPVIEHLGELAPLLASWPG